MDTLRHHSWLNGNTEREKRLCFDGTPEGAPQPEPVEEPVEPPAPEAPTDAPEASPDDMATEGMDARIKIAEENVTKLQQELADAEKKVQELEAQGATPDEKAKAEEDVELKTQELEVAQAELDEAVQNTAPADAPESVEPRTAMEKADKDIQDARDQMKNAKDGITKFGAAIALLMAVVAKIQLQISGKGNEPLEARANSSTNGGQETQSNDATEQSLLNDPKNIGNIEQALQNQDATVTTLEAKQNGLSAEITKLETDVQQAGIEPDQKKVLDEAVTKAKTELEQVKKDLVEAKSKQQDLNQEKIRRATIVEKFADFLKVSVFGSTATETIPVTSNGNTLEFDMTNLNLTDANVSDVRGVIERLVPGADAPGATIVDTKTKKITVQNVDPSFWSDAIASSADTLGAELKKETGKTESTETTAPAPAPADAPAASEPIPVAEQTAPLPEGLKRMENELKSHVAIFARENSSISRARNAVFIEAVHNSEYIVKVDSNLLPVDSREAIIQSLGLQPASEEPGRFISEPRNPQQLREYIDAVKQRGLEGFKNPPPSTNESTNDAPFGSY